LYCNYAFGQSFLTNPDSLFMTFTRIINLEDPKSIRMYENCALGWCES